MCPTRVRLPAGWEHRASEGSTVAAQGEEVGPPARARQMSHELHERQRVALEPDRAGSRPGCIKSQVYQIHTRMMHLKMLRILCRE